jgi:NADH-quinone oxidoreductase subunit E
MSLAEKYHNEIKYHLSKYPDRRSAVMPLLYIAQDEYGHLTEEAIREVADILGLDPTEVHSVAGFYTMFYQKPKGKYLIQVCNDLPCALRGADNLVKVISEHLGIRPGETTEDGLFTLETIMCIAACDKAPVMQINFSYYENMDADKVRRILDDLRAREKTAQAFRGE